jgi:uncharacterized protein
VDSLEEIYAEVPPIRCIGKCQEARGPIDMSATERERLEARGVDIPDPRDALRSGHLDCPALGALGQCTVYEDRPLVCRLFGTVERMTCEHGCKPDRRLSDEEARQLFRRASALGL